MRNVCVFVDAGIYEPLAFADTHGKEEGEEE
jgi:hypothetical protein